MGRETTIKLKKKKKYGKIFFYITAGQETTATSSAEGMDNKQSWKTVRPVVTKSHNNQQPTLKSNTPP